MCGSNTIGLKIQKTQNPIFGIETPNGVAVSLFTLIPNEGNFETTK